MSDKQTSDSTLKELLLKKMGYTESKPDNCARCVYVISPGNKYMCKVNVTCDIEVQAYGRCEYFTSGGQL